MPDASDFVLTALGDHAYRGAVPAHWTFEGRAFGGFTAALTLAAVLADQARPALTSAHIAFLEPGQVGPVEIAVDAMRSGRSAAVVRATATQEGRPILLATAWLVDAWSTEAHTPMPDPFPPAPIGEGPEDWRRAPVGPSIGWLAEAWQMLTFAERRSIDYPTSWDGFARGRPEIALWSRLVDPLLVPFGQLVDVLYLDAHLFDAPAQMTGFEGLAMLSLDLSIAWQPGSSLVAAEAWRRIESRGAVTGGGVSSYATVTADHGELLAVATSQGLIRR